MAANNVLLNVIAGAATTALQAAAANPAVPISTSDVPTIAATVREEIKTDPRIQAINDQVAEAVTPVVWYNDKQTLGSIVAIIASIVGVVWGIQLTPEHQTLIVNTLPGVIGGVAATIAFIARITSRVKPVTATKKAA